MCASLLIATQHLPPQDEEQAYWPNRFSSRLTVSPVPGGFHSPLHGFTLVELLVVITIIGILIALLLPAVQAARESARRMQNSNNLKQIGLALNNYEQANSCYPMLRVRGDTYGANWAFGLLPFMEQQALFDSFVVSKPVYDDENIMAMRTPVAAFLNPSRRDSSARCPFDNNDGVGPSGLQDQQVASCTDYAANRGWHNSIIADNPDSTCCERFRPLYSGPFGVWVTDSIRRTVTSAMITDGLSNTVAVGDKWLSSTDVGKSIANDSAAFSDDSPWAFQRGGEKGFPTGDVSSGEQFGSPSGNSAAFVFLDGHVSSIAYSTPTSVFKYLCSVGDGKIINGVEY